MIINIFVEIKINVIFQHTLNKKFKRTAFFRNIDVLTLYMYLLAYPYSFNVTVLFKNFNTSIIS